jgi:hypothetical protein
MTDTKRRSVVKDNVMVWDPSDPTSALLSGVRSGCGEEDTGVSTGICVVASVGQKGSLDV